MSGQGYPPNPNPNPNPIRRDGRSNSEVLGDYPEGSYSSHPRATSTSNPSVELDDLIQSEVSPNRVIYVYICIYDMRMFYVLLNTPPPTSTAL